MFSLFVNVLRFLDFSLYRVYNSGYFSLYLRQQILRSLRMTETAGEAPFSWQKYLQLLP